MVASLIVLFVLEGCGTEYHYYKQHKSHSPKYMKRQVKYKKYQHHDNGVEIKVRH